MKCVDGVMMNMTGWDALHLAVQTLSGMGHI